MIRASTIAAEFAYARPATTSRGTYLKKKVSFILLHQSDDPYTIGIGECSLLPGLSIDDKKGFSEKLKEVVDSINAGDFPTESALMSMPSVAFALETARKDLRAGGTKILYPSSFTDGKDSVKINGLVWMGSKEDMMRQIRQNLEAGYTCLKMKIGATNLEEEMDLLKYLRRQYLADELEIRTDANGSFKPAAVPDLLKRLRELDIHSIEQPISPGHPEQMALICSNPAIPVALDEELIRRQTGAEKRKLVETIRPQYLVLKPGLLGGVARTREWVDLAGEKQIGWWITSSLETNVGLNAIAQWTYSLNNPVTHGLSTGALFASNIPSPLYRYGERLFYDPDRGWDLSALIATQA